MTDEQVFTGASDFFDDSNFVTNSQLNGKRCTILSAQAQRMQLSEKFPEDTYAKIVVYSEDLKLKSGKKTYDLNVKCGSAWPAQVVDGKLVKSVTGPFLIGQMDKRSSLFDFRRFMVAAGFDITPMRTKGFDAMVGAEFTFRSLEKQIGKTASDTKAYDVPSIYHGTKTAEEMTVIFAAVNAANEAAATAAAADGEAAEAASAPIAPEAAAVTPDDLKAKLAEAVKAALAKNDGEIARGQLSLKVGPELRAAGVPVASSGAALALLLKDEFYAGIAGIAYDKKTVKLVQ